MKTYERVFRNLASVGGQRSHWALPWPGECQLTKLVLTQTGGVSVPFRVNVYNAEIAIDNSQSSGGGDPGGDYVADPRNYRVTPTQESDAPGLMSKFLDDSVGHFSNADVPGSTNRKQKIYIEIESEGSGDQTWDLTLACVRDIV